MLKSWMLLITKRIVCRCGSILLIISSGTLILVIGLFFCVILRHIIRQEVQDDQQTTYGHHLGHHFIFYKHQWGGKLNTYGIKMPHPVGLVIISHTNTSSCQTFASCAKIMRNLERHAILKGLWDICFNFAIGGNGDIYVVRGWDTINCYNHLSIGISFIGNFNVDVVNFNMTHAVRALLQQGTSLGMLSEDYILVAHNQSSKLDPKSPGENVFREIQRWKHYSNMILYNDTSVPSSYGNTFRYRIIKNVYIL